MVPGGLGAQISFPPQRLGMWILRLDLPEKKQPSHQSFHQKRRKESNVSSKFPPEEEVERVPGGLGAQNLFPATESSFLQEGIRTGCPNTPSDGIVSHGKRDINSVGLLLGIKRLPGDPLLLRAKAYIYSFRGTVPLINGEEIFYVCHDDIWRQHGHRHPTGGCQKQCCHLDPSFHSADDGTGVMAGCRDSVESGWVVVRMMMRATCHCEVWACVCGKKWLQKRLFRLPGLAEARGKAIDKLGCEGIPGTKAEEKTIIFSKEQFNAGLRFPLPALFKEFLHFTQIPPVFIHPNIVPSADGMQHHKHAVQPRSHAAGELPDSTKGGATGHVVVRGAVGGAFGASGEAFHPKLLLGGPELRGHLVDWVGKGVLWLSQQIVRDRRQGEASARRC
ncbi:hypothetical protein CK203_048915 [Vitis vinifera]|uniref:Uncharacterized protein n=1 Tax=Vitis vinifera TaxID=29760 RepID=A0A438GVM6_VITVI|nr:hypothetical protein CK203_048915 [Vitis vinifera]